jgi:hypothetical protein
LFYFPFERFCQNENRAALFREGPASACAGATKYSTRDAASELRWPHRGGFRHRY